ncbi:MAG: type II toxin-antitoxin system Phd/YefM family antitoxin [Oscillospiraceae bacterium]|nr:type II toxin-antitoxin system Phd/YefM family antitoxin [Oscillospiraceae bacterium]
MIVTATEFKTHVSRYLALADKEEVLITKNGRGVAKLVNAQDGRGAALRSLRGLLKDTDATKESIRAERLASYDEGID